MVFYNFQTDDGWIKIAKSPYEVDDDDRVRTTIILIDEKWLRIGIVLVAIYHNNSSEN